VLPGRMRECERDRGCAWRPFAADVTKRVAGKVTRIEPPLCCMVRW
jgi:hypothetical protein